MSAQRGTGEPDDGGFGLEWRRISGRSLGNLEWRGAAGERKTGIKIDPRAFLTGKSKEVVLGCGCSHSAL